MKEGLLRLTTAVAAGILIMILHELPKSILYNKQNKNQSTKTKRNIFKVFHYIDPIGLILFITAFTGFSKPYMYRIKEKKTNLIIGITGFLSLACIFMASIFLLKYCIGIPSRQSFSNAIEWFIWNFPSYFIQYMALFSINMFLVNLIPISTFNISLIIAGRSPSKYFSIIKNDYLIKMILILVIIFNIISTFGSFITRTAIGL